MPFRLILAFPAWLVSSALSGALWIAAFLGWFAGLFTGRMPQGLRRLGLFALRYNAQTSAYSLLLTDRYPYAGPPADAEPDGTAEPGFWPSLGAPEVTPPERTGFEEHDPRGGWV